MKFQKRLIYSLVFVVIIFSLSMFIQFVPCKTAPVVPNPEYKWALCNLNPDSAKIIGISRQYFGYTTSLTEAYVILIILSFVIAMVFFHFARKRQQD